MFSNDSWKCLHKNMYSHIGCICLVFATMCFQMPEMMHNHTSLLLIFLWLFSIVCFQMCVLKPVVYQKAKSHWLHLFHFPPCVCYQMRPHNCFIWGYIIMAAEIAFTAVLTIEIKTGLIFALGSNCNQFKYTPQVLKMLQLLPSHHFIATIDIWASIVQ